MQRFLSFSILFAVLALSEQSSTEVGDGPCGDYQCCFDCLCCGPGTKWDDLLGRCIPQEAADRDPVPFDWADKCFLPKCVGEDCCDDEGTVLMTDPTRDAEACWCVIRPGRIDEPTPEPTPVPTIEPTSTASPSECPLPERRLSLPEYRPDTHRQLAATCKDPNGLDLSTVTAPPLAESGATINYVAPLGNFVGNRVSHRFKLNQRKSFLFGASCECVDVASYRIEIYDIANNPWYWVQVRMSHKRTCCSTDADLTVNQACRCIEGGFGDDGSTYENGENFFFDPRDDSDRDLLADVGSIASILGLVIAIALPGPP
jgi:hypothetical protein